jgi:predicted ATPase
MTHVREAAARAPHGSVILIHGAPGVGKTRLLREFVLQHGDDSLVLAGSSYPGSQTLPYHPLVQALRTTLGRHDLWRMVPAVWLNEMLPLLPDLRRLFPGLSGALPVTPSQAQARVLAALTQTLHTWAHHAPLLFCLDDLQWADEGTLSWLKYLAGHWPDTPLRVLATAHNKTGPGLPSLCSTLTRAGRLTEIELGGLSASDVARLLDHLPAPPPTPTAVRPNFRWFWPLEG